MKKKYAEALRCYNDALDIDELSVESLAGRAAVYIETGNHGRALTDAERLLTLNPSYTQVGFEIIQRLIHLSISSAHISPSIHLFLEQLGHTFLVIYDMKCV